jgi:hypothetical protein
MTWNYTTSINSIYAINTIYVDADNMKYGMLMKILEMFINITIRKDDVF